MFDLLRLKLLLQIFPRFFQRSLGVVVGLQGLAVLVHRAFPLSGDVKDLAQLNVAPNLGPARLAVAVERVAIGIGRGLIVFLLEEDLRNPVVRQRTVLADLQRLVELR